LLGVDAMTTFWTLTAATMSCGCGALFALVASTSRVSVPQLVGLQHSEFAPTVAAACDLLRQHRFVAQSPALAASGRKPLSRRTAATAKRRRIIVT